MMRKGNPSLGAVQLPVQTGKREGTGGWKVPESLLEFIGHQCLPIIVRGLSDRHEANKGHLRNKATY